VIVVIVVVIRTFVDHTGAKAGGDDQAKQKQF
jgi:hypothetical protein